MKKSFFDSIFIVRVEVNRFHSHTGGRLILRSRQVNPYRIKFLAVRAASFREQSTPPKLGLHEQTAVHVVSNIVQEDKMFSDGSKN